MLGYLFVSVLVASAHRVSTERLPYFNSNNVIYAECVPKKFLRTYQYYGNASTYIADAKANKMGACANWSDASHHLRVKASEENANVWVFPDETIAFDHCRNFDFTLEAEDGSQHAIMYLKLYKSPYPGPWCYKKVNNHYAPAACFPLCPQKTRSELEPAKPKRTFQVKKRNYNTKIFDRISTSIFDEYHWGPMSYYFGKPSDSEYSQQFAQNREAIFSIMIIFVMLIVVMTIGFHLLKPILEKQQMNEKTLKIDHEFNNKPQERKEQMPSTSAPDTQPETSSMAPSNANETPIQGDSSASNEKKQHKRETEV